MVLKIVALHIQISEAVLNCEMILGTVGYHYHQIFISYCSRLYQVRKNKLAAMIYSSVFSTFSPNYFSALRINTTGTMICMPLRCAGLLADGDGP
jgi:hypothetical protein